MTSSLSSVLALFAGLLALCWYEDLPHDRRLLLAAAVSVAFPALAHFSSSSSSTSSTVAAKKQAVILITLLSLIELLVDDAADGRKACQLVACIVASNSGLFLPQQEDEASNNSAEEEEESEYRTPQEPPAQPVVSLPAVVPVSAPAVPAPPVAAPPVAAPTSLQYASKGAGNGEDVSAEQDVLIHSAHRKLHATCATAFARQAELADLFTLETCRRYLVARQWSEKRALSQLEESVEWFSKVQPWLLKLEESPACVGNPYALSMRVVGLDQLRRPVVMAEFRHATARSNPAMNVAHFERVMEAARKMVTGQFKCGVTTEARQLQLVLVVSFPGFGMQDVSLRTASECIKLLTHFPEFLGFAALVDSPMLFSGAWSTINGLLDDRVRQKVSFLSLSAFPNAVRGKLGSEMTDWLEAEMKSANAHDVKKMGKRAYWNVPTTPGAHDSRGPHSYVDSVWYAKTPGDVWRERHEQQQ